MRETDCKHQLKTREFHTTYVCDIFFETWWSKYRTPKKQTIPNLNPLQGTTRIKFGEYTSWPVENQCFFCRARPFWMILGELAGGNIFAEEHVRNFKVLGPKFFGQLEMKKLCVSFGRGGGCSSVVHDITFYQSQLELESWDVVDMNWATTLSN